MKENMLEKLKFGDMLEEALRSYSKAYVRFTEAMLCLNIINSKILQLPNVLVSSCCLNQC